MPFDFRKMLIERNFILEEDIHIENISIFLLFAKKLI